MRRETFVAEPFAGFAIDSAADGEPVQVRSSYAGTSDDQLFYTYVNQLEDGFLSPAGIRGDSITKFFALQHIDGSVELFTDYAAVVTARVNRDVAKGEDVFVHDISDITYYRVKDVEIRPDDVVICVLKAGWRYALYFDSSRQIEPEHVWQYLGMLLRTLHVERISSNIAKRLLESRRPHIITEGKTDWRHVEAARRALGVEQPLSYATSEESLGDTALLQVCERLAEFGPINSTKVIAMFDRDNRQVLAKLREKGNIDSFQRWGNNVYSLAIPVPQHRIGYKNISIEMLYTDEDLRTKDYTGKRLYFDNELRIEIEPGSPPRYVPLPPIKGKELEKKPFDGKSELIVDQSGRQLGFSKARLAQLIHDQVEPFTGFDVAGFEQLFQIVNEVLLDEEE
ncbi:hypothetical protein [Mangrovihabitans endophyticus]|uniref:Uncharacterized protein n=1 Tax=Mangrovihabitans endophyticus TaxID=1751298 RepID=A0A8J3C6F6_9ACTN|nr:hypothetical protein [Mangrovihabitans endophyticus]GGL12793.1 hypothetical protein GCM10012284_54360 [Mangrovihabitans endophyticus]